VKKAATTLIFLQSRLNNHLVQAKQQTCLKIEEMTFFRVEQFWKRILSLFLPAVCSGMDGLDVGLWLIVCEEDG
jgi:hypothetical protein